MNRLKELRKEKGLTQEELAKDIGVHCRTLQNWENGASQINSYKSQALADFFGVSVGYLLGYQKESENAVEAIENIYVELIESITSLDDVKINDLSVFGLKLHDLAIKEIARRENYGN